MFQYMKEVFNTVKKDKILYVSFSIAGVLMIINWTYTAFLFNRLPPFLPLFNQLAWGEKRVGNKSEIFIPIAIVFAVFISNFLISSFLYSKTPLISRILCITTLLISLFALLFTIRTIGLVL
ncbi:MAG: hypothetical protein A3D75_03250 [Candidatus Levybacteria bacterium RIFCSPHIGHO2_02_FULL_37_18]|nr:MAG: hypothetical protein A3D75_03250 [Candidatus Levybacteria bacterium RIFCSPHIGHO2_02_FULL_37_18]